LLSEDRGRACEGHGDQRHTRQENLECSTH